MFSDGVLALEKAGALDADQPITASFAFGSDELYDWLIGRPLWAFARGLWRVVDVTIIDGLFVNGTASLIAWIGALARRFQNGDVQRYAAVTALGIAALVYVFLMRGL